MYTSMKFIQQEVSYRELILSPLLPPPHQQMNCLSLFSYAMPSHQRKSLISWQSLVLLVSIGSSKYHYSRGGGGKSNNFHCNAQLLNAYDQAYGLWDIKLNKHLFARRRWHVDTVSSVFVSSSDAGDDGRSGRKRGKRKIASGDLQLMFPNIIQQSVEQRDKGETAQTAESEQQQIQTTTKVSKPVKSIGCILNLERSGKFTLSLIDENDRHTQHQQKTKISIDDKTDEEYQSSQATASSNMVPSNNKHQPLQGEWYLTPNPYCVTDRQYDTLLLVSEPRMRRIRSQHSTKRILPTLSRLLSSSSSNDETPKSMVIERATVELRCKLYGRYSMGSIRNLLGRKHGRSCGRMVCGSIVIVKEVLSTDSSSDDNESIRRRVRKEEKMREVIGTFSGRTIVDDDKEDDMSTIFRDNRVSEEEIEDEDESDFEHF